MRQYSIGKALIASIKPNINWTIIVVGCRYHRIQKFTNKQHAKLRIYTYTCYAIIADDMIIFYQLRIRHKLRVKSCDLLKRIIVLYTSLFNGSIM